jgi:hypothetical protein
MSIAALDRIKKSGTSAIKKASKYPIVEDADIVSNMKLLAELKPDWKQYDSTSKVIKEGVPDMHYNHWTGKQGVTGTWECEHGKIIMMNSYRKADTAALADINPSLPQHFEDSFEVKVKSAAIPKDKQDELIGRLADLFEEYECSDALELAEKSKPKEGFHKERHSLYSLETNMAIHELMPCTIQVKV